MPFNTLAKLSPIIFMESHVVQEVHIVFFTKFALLELYLKRNFLNPNTYE